MGGCGEGLYYGACDKELCCVDSGGCRGWCWGAGRLANRTGGGPRVADDVTARSSEEATESGGAETKKRRSVTQKRNLHETRTTVCPISTTTTSFFQPCDPLFRQEVRRGRREGDPRTRVCNITQCEPRKRTCQGRPSKAAVVVPAAAAPALAASAARRGATKGPTASRHGAPPTGRPRQVHGAPGPVRSTETQCLLPRPRSLRPRPLRILLPFTECCFN